MADVSGWEIYKRFYPLITVDKFRVGDPILVSLITGLDFQEFVTKASQMEEDMNAALEQGEGDDYIPDQVVMTGLLAVAFWHGNRQMARAKVVKTVERIPLSEIEFLPGEEEEDEVGPPAEEATGAEPPSTTTTELNGSPDVSLEETSQNNSGVLDSHITFPESLPA